MNLKECFEQMNGNYLSAVERLANEALVAKFLRRFPSDPTMQQLREAVALNDRKAAFMAAHTLKGVAGNLSLTELQNAASQLTEQLRDGSSDPDGALVGAVEAAYDKVIGCIAHLTD